MKQARPTPGFDGGDPSDAKLELGCGIPHRLGRASNARGVGRRGSEAHLPRIQRGDASRPGATARWSTETSLTATRQEDSRLGEVPLTVLARAARSLTVASLAFALACGSDDAARGEELLISTLAPTEDPCCGPNVTSIEFEVSCDASIDETPSARGELQSVGGGTGPAQLVRWRGFANGLPAGECTVDLVAIDDTVVGEEEVYCARSEVVEVVPGETAEVELVLVCTLGARPRADLTEQEVQACIDSGSACF